MKKKIYFITTILAAMAALSLSSCLKDPRYVNLAQSTPIVNFPLGGLSHFSADAITSSSDTIVQQFAIDVASASPPTSATTVNIAVDNTIITAYNATESAVVYQPMPAGSFALSATTVTIPAGQRVGIVTVTFYRSLISSSQSYMLPIKIVSGSGGAIVSGNFGIHYYHFIGNPFAGSYTQSFYRYNNATGTGAPAGGSFFGANANTTGVISPVTPTQFEMTSGYYLGTERYEVTFTQTDATHYQDFQISLNAADVASIFTANGISVTQQPVFGFGTAYAPGTPYTYAQALTFFSFQYVVQNSSGFRFCNDVYVHN